MQVQDIQTQTRKAYPSLDKRLVTTASVQTINEWLMRKEEIVQVSIPTIKYLKEMYIKYEKYAVVTTVYSQVMSLITIVGLILSYFSETAELIVVGVGMLLAIGIAITLVALIMLHSKSVQAMTPVNESIARLYDSYPVIKGLLKMVYTPKIPPNRVAVSIIVFDIVHIVALALQVFVNWSVEGVNIGENICLKHIECRESQLKSMKEAHSILVPMGLAINTVGTISNVIRICLSSAQLTRDFPGIYASQLGRKVLELQSNAVSLETLSEIIQKQ